MYRCITMTITRYEDFSGDRDYPELPHSDRLAPAQPGKRQYLDTWMIPRNPSSVTNNPAQQTLHGFCKDVPSNEGIGKRIWGFYSFYDFARWETHQFHR